VLIAGAFSVESVVRTLQGARFAASERAIQRKWVRRSLLVLIAIAGVYAGATLWIGPDAWRTALDAVSTRDILIVIGLVMIGFLLRAGRWHYYVRVLDWDVPLVPSLTAFVASFALTATPGKAGELVKAALLRTRHDVSLTQGVGILMIERLGDLLALIMLALGGLTLFIDLRGYVIASLVVVGVAALIASQSQIARAITMRISAASQLRTVALKLLNALDAGKQLLRPLPVLVGGALALAAWSCEGLAFHLLVGHLAIHSPLPISFSIFSFSTLAGAMSMLPGGIGGVEVVMALLLTRLAAPASVAAVAVLLFRLCTLWLFSVIGFAFLLGWLILLSRRAGVMPR
jgi:uncharacterized protein (TIRG00374 family)